MLPYSIIVRNIILPCIYFLRKERVFSFYKELQALEDSNFETHLMYQQSKLSCLIDYVVKNIEFYRHTVSKCPSLSNDLTELPLVSKETIRTQMNLFVSKSCTHSSRSTSGTSGQPLRFVKDRKASAYMDAMMYRAYEWHGIQIGDKQARIWGAPISPAGKFLQKAKDYLLNRRRLSVFNLNDDASAKYYKLLKGFKPRYFYAYANGLYQFALSVEKLALDGRVLGVDIAICTGEVLFDYQKEKIREVFGCQVVNEYGSTENGIIGFECELGMMHQMPTVFVETLAVGNDAGEIVVTELNSRSVPFVRYLLGDQVKILEEDCTCGRPYRLMEVTSGRVDGYILCKNGTKVYDAVLAYTLKGFVVQFKAVQEEDGRLAIDLVPRTDMPADACVKILQILKNYLGEDMDIQLNLVLGLPLELSGKLRYFESKVIKTL